ncbi:MAG: hypothetical protein Q8L88_09645 [Bacteroidota bacterium]|nr:hypothetical protein [Bacteroidota bacterium]
MKQKTKIIIAHCIFLSVTFFSFYPTFENGWTAWDDDVYVIDNPAVQHLSCQNVKEVFFTAYNGSYLPLTMISYMIDYQIDGFNQKFFHASNLLFHLCNTILVFWFIYLLTDNIVASFITALLFGIHPMRVESVAWIAARKDVLSMFFFMSSIINYVIYVRKQRDIFLFFTFIFFACALFSKVIVITIPLILFLIDYFLERKHSNNIVVEKIPFVMIAIAFSVIGYLGQKFVNAVRPTVSIIDSFIISLHGIVFYIQKFLLPINLSSLYPYPEKENNWLPIEFYLYAVVCIVLLAIVGRYRKNKSVIFGVLFFIISLLPVLQFIRFSKIFAADRFTYFAYIGLFYIVGNQIGILWETKKRYIKIAVVLCMIIVIGTLSTLTWQRTTVWKNSKTLWKNVFVQYPNVFKSL